MAVGTESVVILPDFGQFAARVSQYKSEPISVPVSFDVDIGDIAAAEDLVHSIGGNVPVTIQVDDGEVSSAALAIDSLGGPTSPVTIPPIDVPEIPSPTVDPGPALGGISEIKAGFAGLQAAAAAFAGAKLLSGAVLGASDLNESLSKSRQVFGQYSSEFEKFASNAAQNLGLSTQEALEFGSTFGAIAQGAGVADASITGLSENVLTLAADLASFSNKDVSQAFEAIRGGVTGEAEPLKQFGIILRQTDVDARAAAAGITTAEAAFQLISEKAGAAVGDFARTSDGFANGLRIAKAQLSDVTAQFGQALLPVASAALTAFSGFVPILSTVAGAFSAIGGVVSAVPQPILAAVAAIATLKAGTAALGSDFLAPIRNGITNLAASAVQAASGGGIAALGSGLASLINPATLAVAAVGAGLAIFAQARANSAALKKEIDGLSESLQKAASSSSAFEAIAAKAEDLLDKKNRLDDFGRVFEGLTTGTATQQLSELDVELRKAGSSLNQLGSVLEKGTLDGKGFTEATRLANAYGLSLDDITSKGQLTAEGFQQIATAAGVSNSAVGQIATALRAGGDSYRDAANQIGTFGDALDISAKAAQDAVDSIIAGAGIRQGEFQAILKGYGLDSLAEATTQQVTQITADLQSLAATKGPQIPIEITVDATQAQEALSTVQALNADTFSDVVELRLGIDVDTTELETIPEKVAAVAKEFGDAVTANFDSVGDVFSDVFGQDGVQSLDEFISAIKSKSADLITFSENIKALAAQGFGGLATFLAEQGPVAAEAVGQLFDGAGNVIPAKAAELDAAVKEGFGAIETSSQNFAAAVPGLFQEIANSTPEGLAFTATLGLDQQSAIDAITATQATFSQINLAPRLGIEEASIGEAQTQLTSAFLNYKAQVGIDPAKAEADLRAAVEQFVASSPKAPVGIEREQLVSQIVDTIRGVQVQPVNVSAQLADLQGDVPAIIRDRVQAEAAANPVTVPVTPQLQGDVPAIIRDQLAAVPATTTVNVQANTTEAKAAIAATATNTTATVTVQANTAPASSAATAQVREIDATKATIEVDSDTAQASSKVNAFVNNVPKAVVEVSADIDEARRTIASLNGTTITVYTNTIPNNAVGGIYSPVSGGRVIRVAEAGYPEVVIPLDPNQKARQQALLQAAGLIQSSPSTSTIQTTVGGTTNIDLTQNIVSQSADPELVARRVAQETQAELLRLVGAV